MSDYVLEKKYLIQLIRAVIKEEIPPSPPKNINWEIVYKLSAMHYVSNIVYYAIEKLTPSHCCPQLIKDCFFKDYKKCIAKEATQHIVTEQILEVFEDKGVACIPLKGYFIKNLYPKPDMRVLSDIDILIKEDQSLIVDKVLIDLGFIFKCSVSFHEIYFKKPFMNVEIHRRLMRDWIVDKSFNIGSYFENVWDKAQIAKDCKYRYKQSIEDYYIFMVAHLAKHYKHSGIGLRHVVDIWVFQNHYSETLNWNYLKEEFQKSKLWIFENKIRHLCEVWFENGKNNDLYDQMTNYILNNGAFGTKKNSMHSDLKTEEKSLKISKFLYIIRLLFPSNNRIRIQYPLVEKLPFLLPGFWLLRGIKCIFKKPVNTFCILRSVFHISQNDVSGFGNFIKNSGLG